ncbi:MAG: glycosyltransferase [Saprospiraceae bacterium]|nr:glycosyltransferase [Saprospiraceae bacterium]
MLLESNLHEDERVQKTCVTLADMGYEVHVLSPEFKSENSFAFEHVQLHTFGVNHFWFKKLFATCLIQPLYHLIWKFEIHRLFRDLASFDVVYVHDLPLIKTGVEIKKKYGLKLVSDQHEYYTEFIQHTPHMLTAIGKMVGKLSNWDKYELKYLPQADLVITVFDRLRERYIQRMPGLDQKIVVLPNSPLKSVYTAETRDKEITGRYAADKHHRAVFVGAVITRERRLDLMIDAIPEIIKSIPDFRFMILGKIHSSYDITEHIRQNNIQQYVELVGVVPNKKIPDYLYCAALGINVHDLHVGQVVHETIFTKFYQYLGMKNVIITTELKVMAEIVRKYKIGKVVKNEPGDIAKAVIELLTNQQLYYECLSNFDKVDNIFWEDTSMPWQLKMREMLHSSQV